MKLSRPTIVRSATVLAALLLLVWVAQTISLTDALAALGRLTPVDVAILLVVNLAALAIFTVRWWVLLATLGHRIPFMRLMLYRLTAFGISYFTPGPHFGGEPYQIYAVVRRHAVPPAAAIAAVALDKLLEMLVNFAMLSLGVMVVILWHGGLEPGAARQMAWAALVLLALPLMLLAALLSGKRPLAWLLGRLRQPPAWMAALVDAEAQSIALLRRRPAALWTALGVTLISWAVIVGEFWLLARLLELPLGLVDAVTVLLAARAAILLPVPAAVGVLEAGQALAVGSLGLDASLGVTLALVVRGRDVLLGLAGLALGGVSLRHLWARPVPSGAAIPAPMTESEPIRPG